MRAIALLLFSLAVLSAPARAQEIPGRAGRLAWFEGNVALYQDPDRGWEEALVNSPITSENSVWTDSGARAELQVAAIALRLDEMSQLDVSRLDDEVLDATLEQGVLAVRIRHLRPSDVVRISTRMASFRLRADGRYRIDADRDGDESRISVFSGEASLETASGPVRLRAGQSIVVWGEDRPAYAFEDAYQTDFDEWALARDERWIERRAPEYVSYEMTGYEDLDAWGVWGEDPVYGVVWFPNRVAPDWAPYRYGRWAYVRPWGWTWIDAEPWGYAPFHYGRWVHIRDRWAWCPGRRVARPVWAPALVGFIGGSDWSVAATSGGPAVGWYPLAPSEPYRPWYRASRTYVNQVNVTVVSVPERVAREHREWNRDRAATVVPRAALVEQRPVAQARIDVPQQALRRAPAIAAPAAALPSHTEVREAHRAQPAARPVGPSGPRAPVAGGAPPTGGREAARPEAPPKPSFAKPRVEPHRAPAGAKPPPANPAARASAPSPGAAQPAAPSRRPEGGREAGRPQAPTPSRPEQEGRRPGPAVQGGNAAQERARQEQQRAAQEQQRAQAAREAQQRTQEQQRAQAAREAQQRAQEQQRAQAAREAQQRAQEQQRAQAARETQQRAQEQQRAQAARETQQRAQEQQRAQAAREAQQRAQEQQRAQAAREAQQRAQEQQRAQAAREAQQRAQEQQRAQAAREAQQRAAQEQQRAQAARAAQQRAQEQQRAQAAAREAQQRAAQEQQRAQAAREAQQRAAQQQQRAQGRQEAPGKAPEKDKEREKGDQGGPH